MKSSNRYFTNINNIRRYFSIFVLIFSLISGYIFYIPPLIYASEQRFDSNNIKKELQKAIQTAMNNGRYLGPNYIERVLISDYIIDQTGLWVYINIYHPNNNTSRGIALGHFNKSQWDVAFPREDIFRTWINILPDDLNSEIDIGYLQRISKLESESIQSIEPLYNFRFPWSDSINSIQTTGDVGFHIANEGVRAYDFGLGFGTPILAAKSGTVQFTKYDSTSGGCNISYSDEANYVEIDHGDGSVSMYAHLQNRSVVKVGEIVAKGQLIGYSGRTGWTCGDHLHFVVRDKDSTAPPWGDINTTHIVYFENPYGLPDQSDPVDPTYPNEYKSNNMQVVKQYKYIDNNWPWSWKYQIGSYNTTITKLILDGESFFELPGCSWKTKWLNSGSHTIQYWVKPQGADTPTPEIQPWPFIKIACAADDGDDPIDNPEYLVPSASFTGYETIPDGTVVSPGQSLTKTWRFKNTGSTTWGSGYQLAFIDAEQMNAPSSVDVPTTAPGETVDVSVPIVAPGGIGEHIGKWRLRNPQGTYFGDTVWIKINVLSANSGGNITMFDVSPASPSSASSVHVVGRARYFTDFRSMHFVIGNEVHEMSNFVQVGDQNEISFDWDTSSLARGDYAIVFEVAKNGDPNWVNAERQIKVYTLTGTPASNNHPPDRPLLKSPYNWYLKDASGSAASVELCVHPASDPDGDSVQYYFEVKDQGGGVYANSGWVSSACWSRSYDPNTYSWRVKSGNSNGSVESDWSTDTWNFTVAKGGVYIGDLNFFQTQTNETHICVMVTYDGIQGPEVYAWLNKANDGSETGEWRLLDHYGPGAAPDCTQSNQQHGFWIRSPEYTTGNHKLRVTAVKKDSGANQTKDTSYTVNYIRPSDVKILAPSTYSNNGTWWNSRTIDFTWSESLRAESYTLRVSTNSNPWADSSPILNQLLGSETTSYSYTFSQDYPKLYWSVKATNTSGEADSGADIWFGIDTVKPTCEVGMLSSPSYENVFQVGWSGTDDAAGIRSINVQYMDTTRDTWKDWLLNAPAGKPYELFNGQPGHTYFFQCQATDNAGNTGNYPTQYDTFLKIDPASRPNELWWDSAYSFKRNLVIQNNMAGLELPAGYPVHLQFNSGTTPTAEEIYNASLSSTRCDDVRIVYNNTTELNRLVDQCTSSSIDIWFRSQEIISGGSYNNSSHQLYYGNVSASDPPGKFDKVFWPEIDSNTLRYYSMREGSGTTLYDLAGNSNASMSSRLSWITFAKFGPAIYFPTDNDPEPRPCVDDGSNNLPTDSFSIEWWMKIGQISGGSIANQQVHGYQRKWVIHLEDYRYLKFSVNSPSDISSDVQWDFDLSSNSTYRDNYHHYAITYNGDREVKFYLDGDLISTKYLQYSGMINPSPISPLRIGAGDINTSTFNGVMFQFIISQGVKTDFSHGEYGKIINEPSTAAGQAQVPPTAGNPDLSVLGLSAYPNSEGGILVQAIVQNQGDKDTLNGFFTDVYVDHLPTGAEDYSGSIQFWVNDPIAVGQIITLTTVVENTVVLRTTTNSINANDDITGVMYAQTDSTGAVPETDNQNNIYSAGTTFCLASADAYESDGNISSASLITSGEIQTHNFGGPSDQDWLKFIAQAGKSYYLQTFNLGLSADTYLYLYDTDGTTLLASNDDYGGSLASRIDWVAPASGTYYLLVKHWNPNAGGCGNRYSIAIDLINYFLPVILR